jgi:CheY-like chemotaxis protein
MPERRGPVLVIDDDADIREAMRDTLSDEGYEAHLASGAEEALDYLRAHPLPPLILLDWNMAPLNGAHFMAERNRDAALSTIPVVLLTADLRAAADATARGFAGCLTKPVDLDLLLSLVGRHCDTDLA